MTELVVVVLELVHDTVAVAFGLQISGIVPRGVVGELPEAAGIPALSAFARLLGSFVDDVEAVDVAEPVVEPAADGKTLATFAAADATVVVDDGACATAVDDAGIAGPIRRMNAANMMMSDWKFADGLPVSGSAGVRGVGLSGSGAKSQFGSSSSSCGNSSLVIPCSTL